MQVAFYDALTVLSIFLALVYLFIWHKHFDVHITLIFVFVPFSNLAHSFFARSQDLGEALFAQKLTYIGGCYLIVFITLIVFSLCDIKLNRWIRFLLVGIATLVFASTQTIGKYDIFYKSVSFGQDNGYVYLIKEYGFMHHVFYVLIAVLYILGLAAMAYACFKKNQVSNTMILLLFTTETLALVSFFGGRFLSKLMGFNLELFPAACDLALILYLIIVYRLSLYDITDTAVDSLVEKGETGLLSFDFNYRYIGSNETARNIFPVLNGIKVDTSIIMLDSFANTAVKWLRDFEDNEDNNEVLYPVDDKIYLIEITYLFDGRRKRGYQFFITDDTRNQEHIKLINQFNSELKHEVEEKTAHIVEMHDNLILGMATMVESRDNSTGGHIRRTSECVRILIETMKENGFEGLSDEFCSDIIKAAPMHDLGKIAVDDAILRFEGRYSPEQYEKMKAHAAEGARIVHEILKSTDNESFKIVAENVAHYHHERFDGSGYPDKLKGEQIPLEARIMAIADVYDALVSKRCYKDKMSFEQADSIIMSGMGTQFDSALEKYYVLARPKLEEYYCKQ